MKRNCQEKITIKQKLSKERKANKEERNTDRKNN